MGLYLALTGGIAAGKSTVARRFSELGAVIVDADYLARNAVAPRSPALAALAARFGDEIVGVDGHLDRPALAALVFGNDEELAALNAIVHPAVRKLVQSAVGRAFEADPEAVVVYDIPLMSPADVGEYDLVVVVDAPSEQRLRRLIDERGLTLDAARRRIDSQPDTAALLPLADAVIDSAGSLEETIRAADEVWATVIRRCSAGLEVDQPPSA